MLRLSLRFPVLAASGALLLYAVSLSHGVTAKSLVLTAKVAGWDWEPMVDQPLLWLLTLPLHLLPAAEVPLGLNFFSAVTAALTLGLLARSVELLPWDRPLITENRWLTVIPVLLACVLCGLEFNFWREATAATGEMLDLLVLAAALWLLLEYRVRRESRWLEAAAFIWGLGMAENWLMLMTFPLFVAGVIWLQGLFFFEIKFLRRIALLILAGFSFYALLPLVNWLAPHSSWSFGHSWLVSLQHGKQLAVALYHKFFVAHRLMAVAVVLYFLVPTLPCLVRRPDESSREKLKVDQFQIWIYRGLRVLLLTACLWLAFDPTTGLRQIIRKEFGFSLPLLTFDYLNALGAAYLAGNLLLISQGIVELPVISRASVFCRRWAIPFAATCLVLIIVALAERNTAAILRPNVHPLKRFGELAAESLPAGSGVMLSDEPQKLEVFQAALASRRKGPDWLAVDTHALPMADYRAWLERRQPLGWLTDSNRYDLTPAETVQLLEAIARSNRLCYLHPSYGYLFERFYLEPTGAIYQMKLRTGNSPEIPALPAAVVDANNAYWTRTWQNDLAPLVGVPGPKPTGWQKKFQRLGYTPAAYVQDLLLAEWYSVLLDGWGVALQRQERWNDAQLRLEQALQLNTNNFSARISLACNTNAQSGRKLGLGGVERVSVEWGSFSRLAEVMNNGGPFDEPVFCYLLGRAFQQSGLPLQAIQQFERTLAMVPGTPAPELALAELYTQLRLPDRARPLINNFREVTKSLPPNSDVDLEVALVDASSWILQTNVANARSALRLVLQQHPDDPRVSDRVLNAYLIFGDYTNALRLVEARLSKTPDYIPSLKTEATILIQSGNAASAIPVLSRILMLTNLPEVRLNRAVARLICQDVAVSETDFRELEKMGIEKARVNYGLALIAEQSHNTNQALHYLRLCLTNTPPETPFWHQASARLQTLEPGSSPPVTSK